MGYVVLTSSLGQPNELPYKLRDPSDTSGKPIEEKLGDINPDFRMGFVNSIGFKGFTLYTLFDWKQGGDIYNITKQLMYLGTQTHADVSKFNGLDGGPTISGDFFRSTNEGLANHQIPNNHFVEDGSFFMLREASLSYQFGPGQLTNFLGGQIENIRIGLVGRNLFTVTDYTGFHPDVTSAPRDENTLTNRAGSDPKTPNGDPSLFVVDAFNYPVARTISGSVQITF